MSNNEYPTAQPSDNEVEKVTTFGEWMIYLIVMGIPCIGIIMTFVWAFTDSNKNRRNYCRAILAFIAISCALSLAFFTIFGVFFGYAAKSLSEELRNGNMQQEMQEIQQEIQEEIQDIQE